MKGHEEVEFIVRGKISGEEISPDLISLSLLRDFTKDIYDLINELNENKKADNLISIEKGSLKIKSIITLLAFNSLLSEIETLSQNNDFTRVNSKIGTILEGWHNKTLDFTELEFEISPAGNQSIKFNKDSKYFRSDENIWVESEIYLYGVITDLGGSQRPNIHLKTEDGKSLTITCTKDDIINEKENHVYHSAALRVSANQNLYSGELKEIKFLNFIDYDPTYDENQILATIEKGRNAWNDVEDHVEWVRNLRLDE
jgi:hypothetical protein